MCRPVYRCRLRLLAAPGWPATEGALLTAQPRDWNEELQALREMPRDSAAARLLRDRALFKFNSDFAAAVRQGAVEVVNGNVMSLNPADETRSQMFIWNNIFFSFAVDSRE